MQGNGQRVLFELWYYMIEMRLFFSRTGRTIACHYIKIKKQAQRDHNTQIEDRTHANTCALTLKTQEKITSTPRQTKWRSAPKRLQLRGPWRIPKSGVLFDLLVPDFRIHALATLRCFRKNNSITTNYQFWKENWFWPTGATWTRSMDCNISIQIYLAKARSTSKVVIVSPTWSQREHKQLGGFRQASALKAIKL